jgi:hypothetical protein
MKGLARGDRKWFLNDGQIPNFRGVCVALGTGSSPVERNRRARLPPRVPRRLLAPNQKLRLRHPSARVGHVSRSRALRGLIKTVQTGTLKSPDWYIEKLSR